MVCVGTNKGPVHQGSTVCLGNVQQGLLLLQHLLLPLLLQQLPLLQLHLQQLQQPQPHLPPPQPPQVPPPQPQSLVMRRVESCVRTLSTTLPGRAAARTPVSASPTRALYARELIWPWVTPASVLLKEALVPVLVLIYAWTMYALHQTAPVSSLSMVCVSRRTPHPP